LNLRAKGLLLRRAGESKTGICPRTPSVVSRTCKRLTRRPCIPGFFGTQHSRAPFRRLPIRAPRQAVLRTSSWLAPSLITNRPCDLPVEKTRDASNRRLPPNQTACTRTSRIPGSLSQLSLRGRPTETKAPCGDNRGTGRFTTSIPLRRIVIEHCSRALLAYAFETRARAFSSHGVDAIEPLTPLSRAPFIPTPHSPSRALHFCRTSFLWKVSYGSEDAETA
jgi:hypothetical protein